MHRIQGSLDPRIQGSLDSRIQGSLGHRIQGSLSPRIQGSFYPWILGSSHPQIIFHFLSVTGTSHALSIRWLFLNSNLSFKIKVNMEKHHWSLSEVSQMQRVWLCLLSSTCCEESQEKSQKCNKCEYLVSHANTLKVHMKIHPGENDVKCNICPSMLHEEYTVKRKSFEVKSHKCNQCEYISDKSSNLTWAMSIHSKEKPFEWTKWKCGTPQANNFREHVVKQHRKIISMQPLWICHFWSN